MEGLLIFDNSNDLIYYKLNKLMTEKFYSLALEQNLISEDSEDIAYLGPNVIIQLFTPIVASQRIMLSQFDNTYTFLQCDNDLNISFEDLFGFLLITINNNSVSEHKRYLDICSNFIQHICGPDVNLLKCSAAKKLMLTELLDAWSWLYNSEQSIHTESIECLLVNKEINHAADCAVQSAIKRLCEDANTQRVHVVLTVQNKLLSQSTSKHSQPLSSSDMIFLFILSRSALANQNQQKTSSHLLFLKGGVNTMHAGCMPYEVHLYKLENDVMVMILVEHGTLALSSTLYDCFYMLYKTNCFQLQNDVENLNTAFDSLDSCVKNVLDALKRAKFNSNKMDVSLKVFVKSWDILKRKYLELFKSNDRVLVAVVDASVPAFTDALKDVFRMAFVDCSYLIDMERVRNIAVLIDKRLHELSNAHTHKKFSMTSLDSYMEEFPGLVHFIHIDRCSGRMTAPNLDLTSAVSSNLIPKQKIWDMIKFSRSYLRKGVMSLMWKDSVFNYSYFLWFEDHNGMSLKPKEIPKTNSINLTSTMIGSTTSKSQNHQSGLLAGDYYQWLIDVCFPKSDCSNIKCFELYCVHLGLVSVSCVLEHNRRLAATICEVTGLSSSVLDLM